MKRLLKKKAWDKINLYHITNSQLFMLIVEDGQMVPGAYVDRASYGTGHSGLYRDIYKPSIHSADQMVSRQLDELVRTMDTVGGYDFTYTKELQDQINQKVDEIKAANPDNYEDVIGQTTMDILETIQPSGSDGVYLSGQSARTMYRSRVWNGLPWPQLPVVNTEFKFILDTDALGPDLDDGFVKKNDPSPPWKQTLDNSGQCIHYGPIPMDAVEGIWFDMLSLDFYEIDNSDILEELEYQYNQLVDYREWMPLDKAFSQMTQFYAIASQITGTAVSEDAVAKLKTKRLKKRA